MSVILSDEERCFYREDAASKLSLLRLRDSPVAIKILRDRNDVKEVTKKASGIRRPRAPITACQMAYVARIHGDTLIAFEPDVFCSYAAVFLGYINPEDVKDVFDGIRDGGHGRADVEAYKRVLDEALKYRIPHGTIATVFTPIEQTPVNPDVILFYCNPAQAGILINAITWWTGERPTFKTSSENGTCADAIAYTYSNKKVNLSLPCLGTRRLGLTPDDQLIVAMTANELKTVVKALEEMYKPGRGRQYPIRHPVEVTPPPPYYYILRRAPPPPGPVEQWRKFPEPPPIPKEYLE